MMKSLKPLSMNTPVREPRRNTGSDKLRRTDHLAKGSVEGRLLSGHGLAHGRIGVQHLDQPTDLEDAQHASLWSRQPDHATRIIRAVLRPDKDGQAGRVTERDLRQIEDKTAAALLQQVADLILELRCRGHVEFACDRHDDHIAALFCLYRQGHSGPPVMCRTVLLGPDTRRSGSLALVSTQQVTDVSAFPGRPGSKR